MTFTKDDVVQQGQYTVAIVSGEGLVARFGNIVLYLADASSSAEPLISTAKALASSEFPGVALAERLATIAFGADAPQTFAVVAPTADGLLVLLRGNVTAEIDAAGSSEQLSGARAFTWVDEIVPLAAGNTEVRVGAGSDLAGSALTDLRVGVVPGRGFVLGHAGAVHDQRDEADDLGAPHTMGLDQTQETPSPAVTAAAKAVRLDQTQETPSPTVTAGAQAVRPSPTLSEISAIASVDAVLVTEDGIGYPLDRAYVIGRDPMRAGEVRDGRALPIVMEPDKHISRVHAYISVDGDAVFVRDNATPGGTFVAPPGVKDWTQIGSTATKLDPGWSIMVGEQILTYREES